MKQLLLLAVAALAISCASESEKDYASFSGKILNKNSDSLEIKGDNYRKVILVDENGEFKDTLHVNPGTYRVFDGGEYASVFLKNGYDLHMTLDTKEFDESIHFEGEGAENSNFIAMRGLKEEALFNINPDDYDTITIGTKIDEIRSELLGMVDTEQALDSALIAGHTDRVERSIKGNGNYYKSLIKLRMELPEGTPSPKFQDYENHSGGTTSFDDLLGKYTYIDVWATWCGPCKAQIPFLKEIEQQYHDKNIQFVSISIDEADDHEAWVSMVNDKELGGIQLFADKDWDSEWVQDYFIKGIPRFILVDPEGKIVSANAPEPSNDELKTLLNNYL